MDMSNAALFALKLNDCVIIAAESRCTIGDCARIHSNNFNKLICIDQRIYLAWSGKAYAFNTIKSSLPLLFREKLADLSSMNDVANMVLEELHSTISKLRSEYTAAAAEFSCELFLVGAIKGDDAIYTIKQGENPWEYIAIREINNPLMKGRGNHFLPSFLEEKPFHRLMTEEEGVMYAFEAIEWMVHNSYGCGGTIRVVAINSDKSNAHVWKQNNPNNCMDPYLYKNGKYFHNFPYNVGVEQPYYSAPEDSDDD